MKNQNQWLKLLMQEKIKGQTFNLDSGSLFNFRLNDSSILLQHIQNQIKNEPSAKANLDQYLSSTKSLGQTKLWIKLEDESLMILNLADIYDRFIATLKNREEEETLFESYDISFLGPLGPFQPLTIVECINEELLDRYLLAQLVSNKLPHRSLRIRTNQSIPATYGADHKFRTELVLEQFSESGMLLSSGDDFFINNMEKGKYIKCFMDLSSLKKGIKGDLNLKAGQEEKVFYTKDEAKYFCIEQEKITKSLSYQSLYNNRLYLFFRFSYISEQYVGDDFRQVINQFKESFKTAA